MKRRKFTQSIVSGIAISSLPIGLCLASKPCDINLYKHKEINTIDGYKLKLNQQVHPTKNQDRKQFILTYDVEENTSILKEKIYDLVTSNGDTHKVFMTPVNDNQLQAVFNWRLNA